MISAWARRAHDRLSRLVGSPLFWTIFILIGAGWPIARTLMIELPPPLPVLGKLPDFTFTNQYGAPYGSQQLRGKVWIANFIFTRCPTICPRFTDQMGVLQHRGRNLGDAFHLVTFTVDPEYDTPARLLEYAQKHKVSPRIWTYLTGDPEAIKRTVVDGLKISMGKEQKEGVEGDDIASIFHGTHFVLVDANLQIRGYYASDSNEKLEELLRDTGLLANRGE